jgi:hypothetical protein
LDPDCHRATCDNELRDGGKAKARDGFDVLRNSGRDLGGVKGIGFFFSLGEDPVKAGEGFCGSLGLGGKPQAEHLRPARVHVQGRVRGKLRAGLLRVHRLFAALEAPGLRELKTRAVRSS